jgi:hypothetical protein
MCTPLLSLLAVRVDRHAIDQRVQQLLLHDGEGRVGRQVEPLVAPAQASGARWHALAPAHVTEYTPPNFGRARRLAD